MEADTTDSLFHQQDDRSNQFTAKTSTDIFNREFDKTYSELEGIVLEGLDLLLAIRTTE
jgi:hypothetical protein